MSDMSSTVRAATTLRAVAERAPGYAAALHNLAAEIEEAAEAPEYTAEAAQVGVPPEVWAHEIAAVILGGGE